MPGNTGKAGENLACLFLKENRYHIITRNYRKPWGEIDIITRDSQGTLVFVEVKTLKYGNFGNLKEIESGNFAALKPEDNLTRAKLIKLKRTCQDFANRNQNLVESKLGWRIDLVAVYLKNPTDSEDGSPGLELTNSKNNCIIKHYHNISGSF